MEQLCPDLLSPLGIEPVLIDIGASGGSPPIWRPIQKISTYIGFDPDTRDIRHPEEGEFRHARIVHEVITPNGDDQVSFYLTRSPYCSSTLKPNARVTDNFLSADFFIVDRQESVRASSLDAIMDRLGLDHIDWMKIDTQGTDLRIYNSLSDALRRGLLAVDIEPGLRGAYEGEDLFSDVHRRLAADGFWLSDVKVCGLVRMRKSTLDALRARTDGHFTADGISKSLRRTPGWTECRYLRSIEWLVETKAPKRQYVLLWTFAKMDQQFGFCLDLAIEYARVFGTDDLSAKMEAESLKCITDSAAASERSNPTNPPKATLHPRAVDRFKRKMKRLLNRS
jgi:FkbM family methyltransferase